MALRVCSAMVCSLSSEPVVLVLACLDESGEHEG